MQCGLVGENLAHSYSKLIHSKLGNYEYELCSVCPEELENLIRSKNFIGLNVTMPYKKAVMKYCNELDSTAKKTGSVNTLAFENGALKGYNTDYFGLSYALKRSGVSLKNKKVIVLGNGGVSATVQALARDLGAKEILVCSSRSSFNYKNVYDRPDAEVIINATPVGMYPRSEEKLIDLTKFKNLSGFADLIYNPFYTRLMLDAKKMKVPVCGGLAMLVAQAKASSEIFMKAKLDDSLIEKIIKEIYFKMANIVLIGMPGSGKTTISKILSEKTGKKFIDSDFEIEKFCGLSIPKIFKTKGENEFRKIENEILKKISKETGIVLSAGGGAVLAENAYEILKQNAKIYWIKRDLSLLEMAGRPLSKSRAEIEKIHEKRRPIYEKFCDKIIENSGLAENSAQKILEDFYENSCY